MTSFLLNNSSCFFLFHTASAWLKPSLNNDLLGLGTVEHADFFCIANRKKNDVIKSKTATVRWLANRKMHNSSVQYPLISSCSTAHCTFEWAPTQKAKFNMKMQSA